MWNILSMNGIRGKTLKILRSLYNNIKSIGFEPRYKRILKPNEARKKGLGP